MQNKNIFFQVAASENAMFVQTLTHCCLVTSYAAYIWISLCAVNTLRQRRNGQHFADGIIKRIFSNENV